MTENEKNKIIAKCASILDKEAEEWNTTFFDFLEMNDEFASDYAMTKAMAFSDAAEMVRELSPDYKAKRDNERRKINEFTKSLRTKNPIPIPNFKDH